MQKLSLSFILNQGEKQQQDNLPASIPSTCERRSSFNFPDVEEEEPVHTLLALKNYIVHQHHQQQHQQHLQQQQQLFVPTTTSTLPPFGIPQPESFSSSLVKKRKLADRDLDDSLNEDDEDISANASEEEDKIKTAKKGGQKKEKKKRVRPTREQAAFLDRYFQSNPHPDTPARLKIAQTINMSPKTVCTWFQNKRARERRALKKQKKNNNTHNSNNTNNSVVFHSDFLQV